MKFTGSKWCIVLVLLLLGQLAKGAAGEANTVASPAAGQFKGMFELYGANRAEGKPNYITSDFVLTAYSMVLESVTRDTETAEVMPELKSFISGVHAEMKHADGPAAAAMAEYLSVIGALLDGSPAQLSAPAHEEYDRVVAAAGMKDSALLKQKLDYTQFKVRGYYTQSPALQNYFRAVRYAETGLFFVRESAATGISAETANQHAVEAQITCRAIQANTALAGAYKHLQERWTFFFGPADDLTCEAVTEVSVGAGLSDPAKLRQGLMDYAAKNDMRPHILSGIVDVSHLEAGLTAYDALTGWRLIPLRFTPDAAAFQHLVFDSVGAQTGSKHPFSAGVVGGKTVKVFPLPEELLSLMGSPAANAALDQTGERDFDHYAESQQEAASMLHRANGLAAEHLKIMGMQLEDSPDRLDSPLGFWIEMRHASVLYTKQSYTPVAKGMAMAGSRSQAWLEPTPEIYGALHQAISELGERTRAPVLGEFGKMLERLTEISQKEKSGGALAPGDVSFLNNLDTSLLAMTHQRDSPLVIDIHTDGNSQTVLQAGLKYPKIVTHSLAEGEPARGALFSVVRFKQPVQNRLTDQQWQAQLEQEALR